MVGIYQIQSKIKPSRIYVGSAVDIKHRWQTHILMLKLNKHHSLKLQRHFNKYGEKDLIFSILVACEKMDLINQEQFFIDAKRPYFNIAPKAGSQLGIKRSDKFKNDLRLRQTGKRHSDESKNKMSVARKGKTKSEITKQKMKENHVGMLGKEPWNKGLTISDPRVKKYIDSKIGKYTGDDSWWRGRKHTEETKAKMKATYRKKKILNQETLIE